MVDAEKEEEKRLARVEKGLLEESRFVNTSMFHRCRYLFISSTRAAYTSRSLSHISRQDVFSLWDYSHKG